MLTRVAWLLTTIPVIPEIDDEEQLRQIQLNLQALIISAIFVAVVATTIYLLNRRVVKKRYATHQARLAAEGKLDRSNALAEIANGPIKPRFINDDAAAPTSTDSPRASVFGDNYRPYGKDGINAPGA